MFLFLEIAMISIHRLVTSALVLPAALAAAEVIRVSPGPGALAAGLGKAKVGDVVKVAAGEYAEDVTVGEGITLEGDGAGKSIILASGYAAVNCGGPGVRILGVSVRGGAGTVRGVNASGPVRVERCRFEKLREAIALSGAPLSDVIACEFRDCEIGVRAIGGASPTVWGCAFRGGTIGIFGMHGSPYVRNNLFDGPKTGIRLIPEAAEPGIIRNNVFVGCEKSAVEVMPLKGALFGTSIRNSVFVRCGAALIAPAEPAASISHAILHGVTAPPFRDSQGNATVKIGDHALLESDMSVSVEDDSTVKLSAAELRNKRGLRLASESQSATGTIGLESAWLRVGAGATAELPPVRFGGKLLVANAVHEEYQYVRSIGRKNVSQMSLERGGAQIDVLVLDEKGEPKELEFDVTRFFGELMMK